MGLGWQDRATLVTDLNCIRRNLDFVSSMLWSQYGMGFVFVWFYFYKKKKMWSNWQVRKVGRTAMGKCAEGRDPHTGAA